MLQERNEHNLLHDLKDEFELYCYTEMLIEFLSAWQSNAGAFEDRIVALTDALIEAQLLNTREKEFMLAWIADLHAVGYKFPVCIK